MQVTSQPNVLFAGKRQARQADPVALFTDLIAKINAGEYSALESAQNQLRGKVAALVTCIRNTQQVSQVRALSEMISQIPITFLLRPQIEHLLDIKEAVDERLACVGH